MVAQGAELQVFYLKENADDENEAKVETSAAAEDFLVIDVLQCQASLQALALAFHRRCQGQQPAADYVLSEYHTSRGLTHMTRCAEACQSDFRRSKTHTAAQVHAANERKARAVATAEAECKMREFELGALRNALALQEREFVHEREKLQLQEEALDDRLALVERQTVRYKQLARSVTETHSPDGGTQQLNPLLALKR
jgi:hypothetical protein